MLRILIALVTAGLAAGIAHADPSDLEGGVFIAHYPASLEFSSNPPPEGWCQHYIDNYAINACEDQVNRIDTADGVIWYVLCAWTEPKEWCGVQFGLGDYDESIFLISDHGPCFPESGLELASDNWPGPNEGTAITVSGASWEGNLLPAYYFSGYAYAEGIISLAVDPQGGFGGGVNCANPPQKWPASSSGAMGLYTDGIYACPPGGIAGGGPSPGGGEMAVCCLGEQCQLTTVEACEEMGGQFHSEWDTCEPNPCQRDPHAGGNCSFPYYLEIAESNRLRYITHEYERTFGAGAVVKVDWVDSLFTLNDTLVHFPHPPEPPQLWPLEDLQPLYGEIPLVQQELRGANDIESWNRAVRVFFARKDEQIEEVEYLYQSLIDGHGYSAAAVLCAEHLRDSELIDAVEFPKGEPPPDGPHQYLLVRWKGRDFTMIILGPEWRTPSAPHRRCFARKTACGMLRILKRLERPNINRTVRLSHGNMSIKQGGSQ
ncbi:MAG: hypothetical protein KAY24_07175 [Candidatus Eisenbacteria sp.]|nr:hypothetical protein [Candidatus Eisenbacteria bacterium]